MGGVQVPAYDSATTEFAELRPRRLKGKSEQAPDRVEGAWPAQPPPSGRLPNGGPTLHVGYELLFIDRSPLWR